MNIKDLEERTGLTRKEIRVYESASIFAYIRENEQLSEQNVSELLKIKLMRALGFEIAEIKKIKNHAVSLNQAVDLHLRKMEGFMQCPPLIPNASSICMSLKQYQEYEQIDAESLYERIKYIEMQEDIAEGDFHPFLRFFARSFDLALASFIVILLRFALYGNFEHMLATSYVWSISGWLILFAAEPLLLHYFGTTPGKWLLGIRVKGYDSDKLSLQEAFMRTIKVFVFGYGCNIAVVLAGLHIYSYLLSSKNKPLAWEDTSYEYYKGYSWKSVSGYAAGRGVMAFIQIIFVLMSYLPPHKGDLSIAQLAENFNYYKKYFHYTFIDSDYIYMNEAGEIMLQTLVEHDDGTLTYVRKPDDFHFNIHYETENGKISAISQAYQCGLLERSTGTYQSIGFENIYLAVTAAQDVGVFEITRVINDATNRNNKDQSTYKNVTYSKTVEKISEETVLVSERIEIHH